MTLQLSKGAIKDLEAQASTLSDGEKLNLQVNYIFQVEKVIKQNGHVATVILFDSDSKYGGFFAGCYEDQKDLSPDVGDIIQVLKLVLAKKKGNIFYCMCKSVKLLKKTAPFVKDPNSLDNLSKRKSNEENRNSVYKSEELSTENKTNLKNTNEQSQNENYDQKEFTLISDFTSFVSNNCTLFAKCKLKTELKNLVSRTTKKDFTLQNYFFIDTKGDEIQATAFGKAAEKFDQQIEQGQVYILKKFVIQLADKKFNQTNCDYKMLLNESTYVQKVENSTKFDQKKYSFISIDKIKEMPIGKLVDIHGFVLEDRGYQSFEKKSGGSTGNRRVIVGDTSLHKIEITIWAPIGNIDKNYEVGELVIAKNLRISEFGGRKKLNTIDATELSDKDNNDNDSLLKKFFEEHSNSNEYQEVQGDTLIGNSNYSIPEIVFTDKVYQSYEIDMDNKERPYIELNAYAIYVNHSTKNYYRGCTKCKKKMETDTCINCSNNESKLFMTLSVKMRDATGDLWGDMFGETAEKFLGMTADVYENVVNNGNEGNIGLISLDNNILYKKYQFYGKVRENTYNEQKRHRFSVYNFKKFEGEENRRLIKYLHKYV